MNEIIDTAQIKLQLEILFILGVFFSYRMTEYDQKYYICDPRVVNWKKYYIIYAIGARKHLLRDSFDNYQQARKRMGRLKFLHYIIKFTCILAFFVIFYTLLKTYYSRLNV